MSRHSRGPRCSQNEVKNASASALNWPMWCPTRISKSLFFFPNIFSRTVFHSARKKNGKSFLRFLLPQFIFHFQQSLRGPAKRETWRPAYCDLLPEPKELQKGDIDCAPRGCIFHGLISLASKNPYGLRERLFSGRGKCVTRAVCGAKM